MKLHKIVLFFRIFCQQCCLRIPLFLYANRCCQKVCRKEPNCAKISFCNIVRTKKKLKMITYSQIAFLLVYLQNCWNYVSNLKIRKFISPKLLYPRMLTQMFWKKVVYCIMHMHIQVGYNNMHTHILIINSSMSACKRDFI